MKELQLEDDGESGDQVDTDRVINAARRPVIITRQKPVIEEMEVGLSDALIAGSSDHPRLKAMLARLDEEGERRRIEDRIALIAQDDGYASRTLREAIVEECCLAREHGRIQVAELQLHLMGVYRQVRGLLNERIGAAPGLDDLRRFPIADLRKLLRNDGAEFGSPNLPRVVITTPTAQERCLSVVRRLRKAPQDPGWSDADGGLPLTREQDEALLALPEDQRAAERARLVEAGVRSVFYRQVFHQFFAADEFDPDAHRHATILGWIEAIEACPHLYPFMQGQGAGQKAFRLVRLAEKLLQLHEIHARVASAAAHPSYRDQFPGKSTRERLQILAKDRFPPLPATPELSAAVMLCPFTALVAFIQGRVAENDLVLPPDPRR